MPVNWAMAALQARRIARRVADAPFRDAKNLPIIYVPGILGVKLFDRTHRADIWGDSRGLLRRDPKHAGYAVEAGDPASEPPREKPQARGGERAEYPASEPPREKPQARGGERADYDVIATETMHHFSIIPKLLTTLVTAELVATLERALGYREGRDLIFLSHDWRRDYRLVAERLELEIRRIQLDFGRRQRVIIIGQSVANLAIRMMVRTCSQDIRDSIAKWYAFGPPWHGTYNSLKMLREGYYPATRRFHGFSPADAATFAPCYQLLPRDATMLDARGEAIADFDLYDAGCWQAYGLGDPGSRDGLQARLDDARAFGAAVEGSDPREQAIPQTWFAGARNHAVCAAVADPEGALITEAAIRKRHPGLADRALAPGDDHIPLDHLTADPCGPLIRSYDSIPYGESYVAIGMAKDHRALINYPQNLETLALDLAAVRANR